ncbi:MAG: hypothetical protein L3J54_07325 [Draconibacterium sp.]|nr:hypothetical protein [Draconibacterium sp.]
MKKLFTLSVLLLISQFVFGQNEIGPEGDKLIWFLLIPVPFIVLFFVFRQKNKKTVTRQKPFFQRNNITIEIEKDRLYYPDFLNLKVKNGGNYDVDLDKPLLILDNFWLKRKFKLKGMDNRTFYPLYLEKGKTHSLQIDMTSFYFHDKRLKKFPKAKIVIYDIKGKKLGSKSVYLRKTLFKF